MIGLVHRHFYTQSVCMVMEDKYQLNLLPTKEYLDTKILCSVFLLT